MSKPKHLAITVVGLSGCGPDVYKGPGKSSLCFNLLHPAEFCKDHSSVMNQDQFESKAINQQHYVYWGSKTEYYYQMPRSKKGTGEKTQVAVAFEIFEQTEFLEDVTKRSFPAELEYSKRAFKLPKVTQKISFKSLDLVFSPEKYNVSIAPDVKNMSCGYIFVVDVGKNCPTFPHQLKLMQKMVPKHRNKFVVAATKYDDLEPSNFAELERVAKELKVDVIPTSIEMEDSRWATDVFRYLAIKLFNLESEGLYGDTYLRYASEEPSRPSPKMEQGSETPPIPPRNYDEKDLLTPSPTTKHKYLNLAAIQSAMPKLKKSSEYEDRITEIPESLVQKRMAKTLGRPRNTPGPLPSSKSTEFSSRPICIPVSPKLSPVPSPKVSTITQSQPESRGPMFKRPLPTLPFISPEKDDIYIKFRCDYEKIDYEKMNKWRQIKKTAQAPVPVRVQTSTPDDGYIGLVSKPPDIPAPDIQITHQKPPVIKPKPAPRKPRKKLSSPSPPSQDCEYEDTRSEDTTDSPYEGYVIDMVSAVRPKYPPRCIPRKYFFLNGRRALPPES